MQLMTISASVSSLVELAEFDRLAFDFRRQRLGAAQGAVGDDDACDTRCSRSGARRARFMSPAPISKAVCALKSEYTRRASFTVAEASDTALAPILVSERTRLAAEKAA